MNDRPQPTCYIGIDFAIAADHLVDLRVSGQNESVQQTLPPTPQAVQEWASSLKSTYPTHTFIVAVEAGSKALIQQLELHQHLQLFILNPVTVAAYRKAFSIAGAKSDPADAQLIREFIEAQHLRITPYQPIDTCSQKLAELSLDRRSFVQERNRIANQLLDAIRHYCPDLVTIFGKACDGIASLIATWPTLEELQRRRPDTLRNFLKPYLRKQETIEEVIQAIQQTPPSAANELKSMKASLLAKSYLQLSKTIKHYDTMIKRERPNHVSHALAESLPGAGNLLGARILGVLGSNPSTWRSASEIACAVGIAPIKIQSGKMKPAIQKRIACNAFDRQTFHEFARCSVRFSPWAKSYFQQKLAQGKSKHVIYRALAFKWIRIIYACWKNGETYHEERLKTPFAKTPESLLTS